MSRVYSYDDVMSSKDVDSTTTPPVSVFEFVGIMMKILIAVFKCNAEDENERNAGVEKFRAYMKKLYNEVVVRGKTYKKTLTSVSKQLPVVEDPETASENLIEGFKGNLAEYEVDGVCWAGVIKGDANDKDTRPHKYHFIPKGKTDRVTIPICTVKLFQACVSIICTRLTIHKNLINAPLCANIIRSYKKANDAGWGIHGHSGLNFVANYVNKINSPATRWEEESASDWDIREKMIAKMPKLEDLLMIALRLDQATKSNPPNQTLRSLIQTCQINEASLEELVKKSRPDVWGKTTLSAASQVAALYASKIAAKSKETKPEAKANKNDEERPLI